MIASNSIALRAYTLWQEEGCPEGEAMRHWLQAEGETRDAVPQDIPMEPAPSAEKRAPQSA